ncbi:hypothetical protein F5Y12DRAFT_714545 [Xylaria sp. FL1777]|nr:hypothetical protein F5Y12DRAFT_714545 [Xylaria sp. FL1777]
MPLQRTCRTTYPLPSLLRAAPSEPAKLRSRMYMIINQTVVGVSYLFASIEERCEDIDSVIRVLSLESKNESFISYACIDVSDLRARTTEAGRSHPLKVVFHIARQDMVFGNTSKAAHHVQRKRLNIIDALPFSPQKEAEVKQVTVEFNNPVKSKL